MSLFHKSSPELRFEKISDASKRGPELGYLFIDGRRMEINHSPVLLVQPLQVEGNFLYASLLKEGQFHLVQIEIPTARVREFSHPMPGPVSIYWMDRGFVKFYINPEQTQESSYEFKSVR